jgi:hypothetical protein
MQGSYGVKDAAGAKALITKLPEMMNSIATLAAAGGSEVGASVKGTSEYNGAEIFELAITNKMTPGAPGAEQAMAMQQAMGMGGDNIPTVYALKGNDLVFAQGTNALEKAKSIADKLGAGDAPAIAPAGYGFADNPAVFFAISVPRMLKTIAKTGAMKLSDDQVPVVPAKPGVAGAVMLNNALEFQLSVSSEDIRTAIAMQPKSDALEPAEAEASGEATPETSGTSAE